MLSIVVVIHHGIVVTTATDYHPPERIYIFRQPQLTGFYRWLEIAIALYSHHELRAHYAAALFARGSF